MIIKLTHANLTPERHVYFLRESLIAWHYNAPTACVIVYTTQNNCIPVKETAEEIEAKLNSPIGQETK